MPRIIQQGGKVQLVERKTLSADTSTVDFDNLDLDSVEMYVMVVKLKNASGAASLVGEIQYEDSGGWDTTDTNYYRQYIAADNAAVTAGRHNEGLVFSCAAGMEAAYIVYFVRDPDGYPRARITSSVKDPTSMVLQEITLIRNSTNNITGIRIHDHNAATRIDELSTFTLYKVVR